MLQAMPVVATVLVGGSVFVLFRWLLAALASEDAAQDDDWRYDVSRINELRRLSLLYRSLQPLFGVLGRFNRNVFGAQLPAVQRQLRAAGRSRAWTPEDFLSQCELLAALSLPLWILVCVNLTGPPGVVLALAFTVLTGVLLRWRLASQAKRRIVRIKRRMPYLLDLLTLLMEAGMSFLQALQQAVREFGGHPVAAEFGKALGDIRMGNTRDEAFSSMRRRLDDDEITSIIGAIVQGERLGSPLATIFRTQADVLRIKRTQRAEAIAGEAGVKMLLPGILIMISTVLIIMGPFAMNLLGSGLEL